jgi:hypothetical protein
MSPETLFRLELYNSIHVFSMQTLGTGTHIQQVAPYGNAILSTVWAKALDVGASLEVKWFDLGPGDGSFPGERIYLGSHTTITTNDTSDRRIVPRLHNKAFCEVIITGGDVTFGIYASAVADFPQTAPYLDGQVAVLASDGGNAFAIYNPVDGKFYLARGPDGSLNVNLTGGTLQETDVNPVCFRFRGVTTPNISQVLISETVPVDTLWKLRSCKIISRCYGEFIFKLNSDIIGEGKCSQAESNPTHVLTPYFKANAADIVKVEFIQNYGAQMDLAAYLQLTSEAI